MTTSPRILTVVLCSLFSFATDASAEVELKKLQGTWVGTETGHENDGDVTLAIDGYKIAFKGWRQTEWYKGTIEISEEDGRSKLFGTIKECPIREFIGKTSNGIYKLEGDTLTIVARAPGDPGEPKDFDDKKSRSFVLQKRK